MNTKFDSTQGRVAIPWFPFLCILGYLTGFLPAGHAATDTAESPEPHNDYGIMQTTEIAPVFLHKSAKAKLIVSLPPGQILTRLEEEGTWVKAQLFNDGPIGYVQRKHLKWCGYDNEGADIPTSISIIDPKKDTVNLLFYTQITRSKQQQKPNLQGIDFESLCKQVGIDYCPMTNGNGFDSGIFLDPQTYAIPTRAYDKSGIFFVALSSGIVKGVAYPTSATFGLTICNRKLYAAQNDGVAVIDPTSMKVVSNIKLPEAADVACWQNKKVYASVGTKNTVMVIDASSDKSISSLEVGPDPSSIWNCMNDKICVWHSASYYRD